MNHTNKSSTSKFTMDDRLKQIAPERIDELMKFANELAAAPQDQKMAVFLSIQQRASNNHVAFSNEERQVLIHVLTEHMSPEEKKKVELIQTLAAKLTSR